MKIFLAGGISGNLREFWQRVMKIYLADPRSRGEVMDAMKVYIAGDNNKKKILREQLYGCDFFTGENALKGINILESFYYLRKNEEFMTLVKHFGSFLLDSGAFTFMSGSHKGGINWDEYVEEYAAFINRWNVQLFFELDIDSVVGLTEVERLREKLEALTGKKPTAKQLSYIYSNKTAALLECAMTIGGTLAGVSGENLDKLQNAAYYIGMAFQVQDLSCHG